MYEVLNARALLLFRSLDLLFHYVLLPSLWWFSLSPYYSSQGPYYYHFGTAFLHPRASIGPWAGRVRVTLTNRWSCLRISFTKTLVYGPYRLLEVETCNVFGAAMSLESVGMGYNHVLCVIQWDSTYSFPIVRFRKKIIAYLLYSVVSVQVLINIFQTEYMLGINIYVKEVRYRNQFLLFFSFKITI